MRMILTYRALAMMVRCSSSSMVRGFLAVGILAGLLHGCAAVDTRVVNPEHAEHPAYKAFVAYSKTVSKHEAFDDSVIAHFLPSLQGPIAESMGWYRLVFSSSHQALRQGKCEEIYLQSITESSVQLNCKGPFEFVSHFGFKSQETMHLRTYIRQEQGQWYIGRSGLFHTMGAGNSVPRSIGLKFD